MRAAARSHHLMCPRNSGRRFRAVARRGFTLIETALATVIVGVGVLAMVSAQQAFHKQNFWSTHASIATRLGNEIREMTLNLPRHDPVTGQAIWGYEANESSLADFDDLDDFDGDGGGLVFSADNEPDPNGPVNAMRQIIPNMEGWSQLVFVESVSGDNITQVEDDGTTTMLRVRVIVRYQGPNDPDPVEITTVSWIAPN